MILETLIPMTLSYLHLSTKFPPSIHPRLSQQCNNISKSKETQQKVLFFHSNVTGELGNSRSGQESVLLAQGQKHNRGSREGLSFHERPDSESCCSGSGVQKHPHLCCCYETRIKVAKSHHQRHLALHRLRRAVSRGGWEDGSTQHSRTTAGSCSPVHTCTESSLLLRLFSPLSP